jgi:hypothetical protein
MTKHVLEDEVTNAMPPQVIGYERVTCFKVGDQPRRFICGADSYPHSTWPSHDDPIYRGEVPAEAACEICGIDLNEL